MNEPAKSSSGVARREAPQKVSAPKQAISSHGVSPIQVDTELLQKMDAWWRAANYLNIGQIYLMANPLLREPLKPEHIKPRLLGHWGTSPGLNLIYVHLNRLINKYDLDVVYMAGPGHGGPAIVANVYLEGTYTINIGHDRGSAMSRAGHIDYVEVIFVYKPVKVDVNQIQPWRCSPMT